jgi:Ca2+-binding RTX toxin-like protein
LIGGKGADTLSGATGSDTYVWAKGDGNDSINDYAYNQASDVDTLKFIDVNAADVQISRSQYDLYVTVASTSEKITVKNYFSSDIYSNYKIEQIVFADGTKWATAALDAAPYRGTDSADAITGTASNEVLMAAGGNDIIASSAGIDLLFGGDGNDSLSETEIDAANALFGGTGTDTLTSGIKADFMAGGVGNDTYTLGSGADVIAFNTGDGADTLNTATGSAATLSLGKGIKLSDLTMQKSTSGLDLILNTNAGKTESLTLKNWFATTPQTGIAKLQVMVDTSTDYSATSLDKLKNKRIVSLNFQTLASAFKSSGTANGSAWSVMNAALTAYLASSDNMALGGELAYQYGEGNIGALSITGAQSTLTPATFGASTQSVTVGLTLPAGQVGLTV